MFRSWNATSPHIYSRTQDRNTYFQVYYKIPVFHHTREILLYHDS